MWCLFSCLTIIVIQNFLSKLACTRQQSFVIFFFFVFCYWKLRQRRSLKIWSKLFIFESFAKTPNHENKFQQKKNFFLSHKRILRWTPPFFISHKTTIKFIQEIPLDLWLKKILKKLRQGFWFRAIGLMEIGGNDTDTGSENTE